MTNLSPIKLPTSDIVVITHVGDVQVTQALTLQKVLCVPNFQHSLLSIQKLLRDCHCEVQFFPKFCVIIDAESK